MLNKIEQAASQVVQVTSQLVQKDVVPLSVGWGMIIIPSLKDMATKAEQVGLILGALLVAVTLLHRIWLWRRDLINSKKD